MNIESIYPTNIIIKHDYIKINNKYISTIIIEELPKEISMLEMNNIIPKDIPNNMTIYINKLDLNTQIKNLSKIILETDSEIKSINKHQQDIDILKRINNEATILRKKIQIENEELYKVNIYICVNDIYLDNLKLKVNKMISTLYTKGIVAKIANFRHDQIYLNTLPINNYNDAIIKQTGLNVVTSQLSYMIPYINNNIYNLKGVLYGFINNSFCLYDIFSENNMNYNMCILGSSGAGKSYFIKTILLRNFCMNIRQIIFDIEEEYLNIAEYTNAIIFKESNFNMLYIPEIFVKSNKEDFLTKKIEMIFSLLNNITNYKLNEYKNIFVNNLRKIYSEKRNN